MPSSSSYATSSTSSTVARRRRQNYDSFALTGASLVFAELASSITLLLILLTLECHLFGTFNAAIFNITIIISLGGVTAFWKLHTMQSDLETLRDEVGVLSENVDYLFEEEQEERSDSDNEEEVDEDLEFVD
uniref:Transmembrane protein n=1 Tax=Caenorhabditis japonica TaxID=281687 RepID=A0A8R1DK38_CAEJA